MKRSSILGRILPPAIAAAALLGTWAAVVATWRIPAILVPSPLAVASQLRNDADELATATCLTAATALIGLTLSLIVGSATGLLFAKSKWLRRALYPYAIFLQTVPIVAMAPLLVLWMGYGPQSVVAVAFILSLFPIITNVTAGLMSVPVSWRELIRLYNGTSWQQLCKLEIPHTLPHLATGLKTSSGLSVIGAIVGEFFVGYGGLQDSVGLGFVIRSTAERYETPRLFAAVICSTLLGVLVFAVVSAASEWLFNRRGLQ